MRLVGVGRPNDSPDRPATLRIALADDAVLLREALAAALAAAGFEVVGQAADVPGLLRIVARERPDVVVVDVRMPPTHTTEGLEAARQIRSEYAGTAILVLSQYVETRYALDLLRDDPAGIGYLLKERVTRIADLTDAVRRVAAGGSVVDPEVVGRLLGRARRHSPLTIDSPRTRRPWPHGRGALEPRHLEPAVR
jgi:DNA-binding NarL/FixJ family response regulator